MVSAVFRGRRGCEEGCFLAAVRLPGAGLLDSGVDADSDADANFATGTSVISAAAGCEAAVTTVAAAGPRAGFAGIGSGVRGVARGVGSARVVSRCPGSRGCLASLAVWRAGRRAPWPLRLVVVGDGSSAQVSTVTAPSVVEDSEEEGGGSDSRIGSGIPGESCEVAVPLVPASGEVVAGRSRLLPPLLTPLLLPLLPLARQT